MNITASFIQNVYNFLSGSRTPPGSIVRKHSKNLEKCGDFSFCLDIQSWRHVIGEFSDHPDLVTIFDYLNPKLELHVQVNNLIEGSKLWDLQIEKCDLLDSRVNIFVARNGVNSCIRRALEEGVDYGICDKIFENSINLQYENDRESENMNFTELRMFIVRNVGQKMINSLTNNLETADYSIKLTVDSNAKFVKILCGPVCNEFGVKDQTTLAATLFKKRSLDLQLIAQHKYGIKVKSQEYFAKLAKDAVIFELLDNKINKPIRITVNYAQTAHKGAAFIFYNYARISGLLREFNNGVYPELPLDVDLSLLKEPEEWEIIFIYILQFPQTVLSCVCDIKKGHLNIHNIVLFLSNLSSIFSIYYRRVKILTQPKQHLLAILFARIYLIKAIQHVFYNSLQLLDIKPIEHM